MKNCCFFLLSCFLLATAPERSTAATLSGELKTWHRVTLEFTGPETSETQPHFPTLRSDPMALSGASRRKQIPCSLSRIKTLNPGLLKVSYHVEVRASCRTLPVTSLGTDAPGDLKPAAIPFLFPSRYCQSDRLRQQAQELFGHLNTTHEIASAVSDWIFENISYVAGSSGEFCSAIETVTQRQGVCRDFAHLGIAFCRAMNVPARYTTCYAFRLNPTDFHACYEVLIGDTWHVFDPTRLAPLNGLVRIATGRDASDTAVCTIFGNPELTRSFVYANALPPVLFR